jgi:hypothetical protein
LSVGVGRKCPKAFGGQRRQFVWQKMQYLTQFTQFQIRLDKLFAFCNGFETFFAKQKIDQNVENDNFNEHFFWPKSLRMSKNK